MCVFTASGKSTVEGENKRGKTLWHIKASCVTKYKRAVQYENNETVGRAKGVYNYS